MRRDRHVSIHDLARELAKRLIIEKLPNLQGDGQQKSLFTINEIKALARGQKGKPTELHKSMCKEWAAECAKRMAAQRKGLEINTEFFDKCYTDAKSKISSLLSAYALKQYRLEELHGHKRVQPENDTMVESKVIQCKRSKPFNGHRTVQAPAQKVLKGAHWEAQEKERFFKWFKIIGKDWKALRAKFPAKTDKQLRNFYQNNRSKLSAYEGLNYENEQQSLRNGSFNQ